MHPAPSGPPPPPAARQPFTWGGLAALARGSVVLWLVWVLGIALIAGGAAAHFLQRAWMPAIEQGVRNLPASGALAGGRLDWPSDRITELGRTPFLALRVNPQSTLVAGEAADVEIEFAATEVSLRSLFGYWILPYPAAARVPLDRPTLEPLLATWSAYSGIAFLLIGGGVAFLIWSLLGLVATPFLRTLAAVFRRDIGLGGCWRMAVAACLPGTILIAAALVLHADRGFRLPDFLTAGALGVVLSLLLLAGAPWTLPRRARPGSFAAPAPDSPFQPAPTPPPAELSPFAAHDAAASEAPARAAPDSGNPFATGAASAPEAEPEPAQLLEPPLEPAPEPAVAASETPAEPEPPASAPPPAPSPAPIRLSMPAPRRPVAWGAPPVLDDDETQTLNPS